MYTSAALLMPYSACAQRPLGVDVGEVDDRAARSRRWRRRGLRRKNGARALAANSASHWSGVAVPTGVGKNAEALLTSASRRPKRPTRARRARQPIERRRGRPAGPRAAWRVAFPVRRRARRPPGATAGNAGRRRSRRHAGAAMAAPRRRAPPVTRATGGAVAASWASSYGIGQSRGYPAPALLPQSPSMSASPCDPASPPDPDALAHSDACARDPGPDPRRRGAIPFSRFMELCLYAPGLGYYSAGATKFGAAGDFVTAPELGPLFAACVADSRGAGAAASSARRRDIVELGGGSGAFAEVACKKLLLLGREGGFRRLYSKWGHLGIRFSGQRTRSQSRGGWPPRAVVHTDGKPRRIECRHFLIGERARADLVRPCLRTETKPETHFGQLLSFIAEAGTCQISRDDVSATAAAGAGSATRSASGLAGGFLPSRRRRRKITSCSSSLPYHRKG